MSDRQDHIDAMEAAAEIGEFETVERVRRYLNLKICSICRGPCSYENAWRVLWRDTLLHVCEHCADNHCGVRTYDTPHHRIDRPPKLRSITYEGKRFVA